MNPDIFSQRHIGPNSDHLEEMLAVIGVDSIDELIDQTIPNNIRLQTNLNLDLPLSEQEFLEHIHALGSKNKVFKSYNGMDIIHPIYRYPKKYFRKSWLVYRIHPLPSRNCSRTS